jgi:D-alanyl-D-alanine carboxypeptidase
VTTLYQRGQSGLLLFVVLFALVGGALRSEAAPYAALVMDARSGEVYHSRNADTRLHPASLTKMMTLYIAFEAVRLGEVTMDTKFKISRKAASEPPSKLGLRSGQQISLRYLVRAASVKSANDAATAIAEGISGSEAAFARRMNRTAKALGMTSTTFKNAHGLTETGHLSTARDMSKLGRRLFYDYPQYYNLFSRRSTDAGIKKVSNTNRRFLGAYKGSDGIKTGYTRAAGFNLVASAERGNERIIATVFGGRSTADRNAKVAKLLDMGFKRAPRNVAVNKPVLPTYTGTSEGRPDAGKTLRVVRAVATSPVPTPRPAPAAPEPVMVAMQEEIEAIIASASIASETLANETLAGASVDPEPEIAAQAAPAPVPPAAIQQAVAEAVAAQQEQSTPNVTLASLRPSTEAPKPRPSRTSTQQPPVTLAVNAPENVTPPAPKPVVVTRLSTSGGRLWGVTVGQFSSRHKAERVLLTTALKEMATLDGSLRKVVRKSTGYDANFVGLSQDQANLACERLLARGTDCTPFGPG